jgi:hypothetical protein
MANYSAYTNTASATTWTAGEVLIRAGNTVAWYDSTDLTTITKDGSDFVSLWKDKLLSGNDLVQATGTNQPKWVLNDGVVLDGVDNFMIKAFTLNQPCMVYFVFRQITWTINDVVIYGGTDVRSYLRQHDENTVLSAYQGTAYSGYLYCPLTTFHLVRWVLNGANSKIQKNNDAAITGDFGATALQGLTLGSNYYGILNSNVQFKEIILRSVADDAGDETNIYNYLAGKHGFPTI